MKTPRGKVFIDGTRQGVVIRCVGGTDWMVQLSDRTVVVDQSRLTAVDSAATVSVAEGIEQIKADEAADEEPDPQEERYDEL